MTLPAPLPSAETATAPAGVPRGVGALTWIGSALVDLGDPDPAAITLEDVARNLSRIARYNGATRRPFSVAEHCILCDALASAEGLSPADRRAALMHDAAEAVVGDLTRPCKIELPEFAALEARVWRAVALRFGLAETPPPFVKRLDDMAAAIEKRDLVTDPRPWPGLPEPSDLFRLDPEVTPAPDAIAAEFRRRALFLGAA